MEELILQVRPKAFPCQKKQQIAGKSAKWYLIIVARLFIVTIDKQSAVHSVVLSNAFI